MTPEQIRVAVAEELGWRVVEGTLAFPPKTLIDEWLASLPKEQADQVMAVDYCEIPNYDSDLNACHEMEKMLKDTERVKYGGVLHEMYNKSDTGLTCHPCYFALTATPLQRCEAFLRVRNKWRDK